MMDSPDQKAESIMLPCDLLCIAAMQDWWLVVYSYYRGRESLVLGVETFVWVYSRPFTVVL